VHPFLRRNGYLAFMTETALNRFWLTAVAELSHMTKNIRNLTMGELSASGATLTESDIVLVWCLASDVPKASDRNHRRYFIGCTC
jgi:hypothetical protein